jgi:hypothetical protein
VEELLRKLLLSAVVVLIDEGSPLQVTLAVLVSGWAHVLHAMYKPWGAGSVLYRLQHGSLFVTSFVFLMGLLFKVDGVSSSSSTYQSLSVFMVTLCAVFMGVWVALVLWRVVVAWRQRDVSSTAAPVTAVRVRKKGGSGSGSGGVSSRAAAAVVAASRAWSLNSSGGGGGGGGGGEGGVSGVGGGGGGGGGGGEGGVGVDAKACGGDAAAGAGAARPSAMSLHSFSSADAPADAVFGVCNPLFAAVNGGASSHGAAGSSSSMQAAVRAEPRRATAVAKTLSRRAVGVGVGVGVGVAVGVSIGDGVWVRPYPVSFYVCTFLVPSSFSRVSVREALGWSWGSAAGRGGALV